MKTSKLNTITKNLFGVVLVIVGGLIGYLGYLILKTIYYASSWLAGLIHAPEPVALIIALLISVFFLGIIMLLIGVAAYIIIQGIILISER